METAEKIQLLKEVAPEGFQFSDCFFTEDCENITDICIETNQIWTWKSFTASCGCCSDTTEDIEDLDWFIDHMSETDFDEFIEWIKNKNS